MGLSLVCSRGCVGVEAPLVTVEVYITGGLPTMSMVGLPATAVTADSDVLVAYYAGAETDRTDIQWVRVKA